MRALITVERRHSPASSFLVGPRALAVLESLPGVSEIRIEHEGATRAVLSYRWRDPGIHTPGIGLALSAQGISLI